MPGPRGTRCGGQGSARVLKGVRSRPEWLEQVTTGGTESGSCTILQSSVKSLDLIQGQNGFKFWLKVGM